MTHLPSTTDLLAVLFFAVIGLQIGMKFWVEVARKRSFITRAREEAKANRK